MRRWLVVLVLLLSSCAADYSVTGTVTGKRYMSFDEAFHLAYITDNKERGEVLVPFGDYSACHVGDWIRTTHKRFGEDRASCAPNRRKR